MTTAVTDPNPDKGTTAAGEPVGANGAHIVVSPANDDRVVLDYLTAKALARIQVITWAHRNEAGENFYVRADIV
jgi:hypothetical protein